MPGSEPGARTPRSRFVIGAAAALASGVLLGPAALQTPRALGDSGEYFLMAESLFRHGSTELRSEDLAALDGAVRLRYVHGTFGDLREAYRLDRAGRARSLHFWAYPLVCLPAKAVLHVLGANELRALPITNAVLFLFALLRAGPFSRVESPRRWLLPALLLLSPAAWFVAWPHPEVLSCSLATLALVYGWEGRPLAAVLMASLAALQNPPLGLLALVLFANAVRAPRHRLLAVLALALAFVPFAVSAWTFGRLSPLSVSAAGPQFLSARKALELFFDLNLGLLPYVPIAVLGAVGAPLALRRSPASFRGALESWGVLLAMAFVCTAAVNWNHGTAGPSRYGVWMLPLVLGVFLQPLGPGAAVGTTRNAFFALALLALVVQAGLLVARGGPDPRPDYLEHSYAARFVLDRAPALYNPSNEIFMERTRGREDVAEEPVIYRTNGRCRKALTQKRYWQDVIALCGASARVPDFKELALANRRGTWVYVDY
jgi:hypothetical protein